ncbi:unnamed protein product [Phytophthora fragariaefolia]|uniref:Unnamed protein product n=1 Tax=Phytophthora fragariaefolia TaxID=1490495 RepID=A0A9W6U7L9_9STRA|nr:unnamed protein product [Phytophthora fragariaefolia]
MLRHLESCPNCPRKVVETVKELCGRRERSAHSKKQGGGNAGDGGSDGRLEQAVTEDDDDQVLLLDAVAVSASAVAAMQDTQQTTAAGTEQEAVTSMASKRTAREALVDGTQAAVDMPRLTDVDAAAGDKTATAKSGGGYLSMPSKRGRTDSGDSAEQEEALARWRVNLLQTAVAAGIPLSAFQKSEFQELVRVLSPVRVDSDEVISSVGGQAFVEETAAKLAQSQLDRVKEGMMNSTIKSGLTLSITCWDPLDLQHLVAFTLVNSNGDAACVRVEDLGGHIPQHLYTDDSDSSALLAQLPALVELIEDVLQELSDKNICVMGIVADSTLALMAAKRVCCSDRWHSLLVVPCMSALLTSLVGSVLVHEAYCDVVGQLVELVAYFSNARLQTSLRAISGEDDARIPLPTREHWFSFVACLTKVLHYSDAITALCSSQDERGSALAPLALRELVLGGNGQLWKTLRELAVLLAPLREAYSLVFQTKPKLGEISAYDNDDECATTVHGGLTLAHVMYQLGRMSQQYAALAESADLTVSSANNGETAAIVAQQLHGLLDALWQRYDLPTMILAYVFDFHMDTGRLDMSNKALQWKAVQSYFQHYYQNWFCQPQDTQNDTTGRSTLLGSIPSNKVEGIISAYQLRQFPFDVDTTSDYTDVSSFYSFVSESHPEICALCCRVYAVALACADLRRVVRGIGFLPSVAQTTERPKRVELLLQVGFASSLKRTRRSTGSVSGGSNILPELLQTSRPEELFCSQDEWDEFAIDWKKFIEYGMTIDEWEQLHHLQRRSISDHEGKSIIPEELRLSLDQLFFEALPPLPAAVVVAPSPHDPSGAVTQPSVAL